jgi:hypothetical protein
MEDRAEKPTTGRAAKFSKLDWPTPEMLRAAHSARGQALRDIVLALGYWFKRWQAPSVPVASRVRAATGLGRSRAAHR